MKHLACTVLLAASLLSCTTVEGTGRQQFIITSPAQENEMGATAYKEVQAKEKICTDAATVAFVKRVGERLAKVADPGGVHGFQWEFTVLESNTVNAFCLPGGKVAVYTGILPYCQNEAGLAAVMGHEIGHAIARHGGERMTQATLAQTALTVGAAAAQAKGYSDQTIQLGVAIGGLGAQYGAILPFSRKHESEADYLGLKYMAEAGYDPAEAATFWQRFAKLTDSGSTGIVKKIEAFSSTHPQSSDRATDLKAKEPEAKRLYDAAPVKYGAGEAVPAKYRTIASK
jgi:predicted Zn-dependent protease